jgi:hypothetical protein
VIETEILPDGFGEATRDVIIYSARISLGIRPFRSNNARRFFHEWGLQGSGYPAFFLLPQRIGKTDRYNKFLFCS